MPSSFQKFEGDKVPDLPEVSERYGLAGIAVSGKIDMATGITDIAMHVCDPAEPMNESKEKWIGVMIPAEMLADIASQLLKVYHEFQKNQPPTAP